MVLMESFESEYLFMLPSGCGARIAVTWFTAIEVAHESFRICRSLTRLLPKMLHDAMGVLSRLPETMNAGAKRSTGFLNDELFPRWTKSASHSLYVQAP